MLPTLLGGRMPTLLGGGGSRVTLLGGPMPVLLGADDGTATAVPGPLEPVFADPVATAIEMARIRRRAVVLGVLFLGATVGLSALHGAWAYDDWTCAFKHCVAVAPVRRRRKS